MGKFQDASTSIGAVVRRQCFARTVPVTGNILKKSTALLWRAGEDPQRRATTHSDPCTERPSDFRPFGLSAAGFRTNAGMMEIQAGGWRTG